MAARPRDAHKGQFGRVLIVGGSVGMVGAPALAANAALRGGAGLVKIACPGVAQQAIASLAPCATSWPLPCSAEGLIGRGAVGEVLSLARQHDVLGVGPGIGQSQQLRQLIGRLLRLREKPIVIDADGLNNLAAMGRWWSGCQARLVLTPHPGEMARLLEGAGIEADLARRDQAAAVLARQVRAVVVLKGAGTVVTDGQKIYLNRTGNPGMATAGSGDVLTGLIAALIGQRLGPFDAAVLGVYLHGKAGDLAARSVGQISLTAADLVDWLPRAFRARARAGGGRVA
ncbi:MAG: NAD(P)H-hydrate dehydratase [Phycisphaerae bacterium]